MGSNIAIGARAIAGTAGKNLVAEYDRPRRESAGGLRFPTDFSCRGVKPHDVIVRRSKNNDVFEDAQRLWPGRSASRPLVLPDQISGGGIESLNGRLCHSVFR